MPAPDPTRLLVPSPAIGYNSLGITLQRSGLTQFLAGTPAQVVCVVLRSLPKHMPSEYALHDTLSTEEA